MLNVLHVVSPMGRGEVGGAERHALDLAVAQQSSTDVRPALLELGDKGYAALAAGHGIATIMEGHPYAVGAVARTRRAAGDLEIDVVHSHGYDADFLATTLARRHALVATTHGFVRVSARTRCKTALNERCLRRFDAVIATRSTLACDGSSATRSSCPMASTPRSTSRRARRECRSSGSAGGCPPRSGRTSSSRRQRS